MNMLHTTRAVVLRTFKHGDNTTIAKTYTEAFGARAYLVRTGKKGGAKPAHLQPLARVELVVTEGHDREMHAIREIRTENPYTGIAEDHLRGLLLLFAQEVFYRTLRTETPDKGLFNFVQQVLEQINKGEKTGNIPLLLLIGLARHLGFMPGPPMPGEDRFDMREGQFFQGEPHHAFCIDAPASEAFAMLLRAETHGADVQINPVLRKTLLDQLLTYFRLHVEGFGQLRSPEVLHAVLH